MLIRRLLKLFYKSVAPQWVKNALHLTLSDIERYQQIPALGLPPGTRILVLAPHPDDPNQPLVDTPLNLAQHNNICVF